MFIDSHCHLSFPELSTEIDAVLARMRASGVVGALNVCTTLEEFSRVRDLAGSHDNLCCSVGVHPDYLSDLAPGSPPLEEPTIERLVTLAAHPKVVAIGETGLDYYRLKEPLDWQRERFRVHIRAARSTAKPLIVHTRAAAEDTIRLMREEGADACGGVMHCFTEDWATACAALDLGFYISFSGIVTFRNANALRDVARRVPDDRFLIETDSPYLAPVPMRGKANEPAYVAYVAAGLASVRGQSIDRIGELSTFNFQSLFRYL